MRIWKHELRVNDEVQTISAPAPWEVVHVESQNGGPSVVQVWLKVPDLSGKAEDWPTQLRSFRVVGTGHSWDGEYVGSAIVAGGMLVWHVIEVPSP